MKAFILLLLFLLPAFTEEQKDKPTLTKPPARQSRSMTKEQMCERAFWIFFNPDEYLNAWRKAKLPPPSGSPETIQQYALNMARAAGCEW